MPSGAKKRKAAKKKKEKENSINPPQGNGELKSLDEKESDGGEGSSPTHHDHDDRHHPFNGGSEEVEASGVRQPTSDAKSTEEVPSDVRIDEVAEGNETGVVMIERDLKFEESSEAENASFERIETAKESYHGNGNGNTGGTSNDEFLNEENSKDENHSIIEEAITCHKLVDSSTTKMASIVENVVTEEHGSSAAESSVNPVEALASMSEVENSDSVNVLLEKSAVPSLGVNDLSVKVNEDNVFTLTEKARTSSLEEPPEEYDINVLASLSNSPSSKLTNGTEHIEDSETPACSKDQPPAASAPPMMQKTSWLSCCGLFEVLSGSSNR